ncbi:unnamed protein product, partial [Allacma fusca]
ATKKELYQSIRKLISPPITAQFVSIDESLDSSKSESETSRKSIVDPLNIPQNIVDDLRKPKNPKTVLVKLLNASFKYQQLFLAAVRVNYPDCKRIVYEADTKDWLEQAPARLKLKKRNCERLE